MSIYTPPALNAVNFALEAFTPADMTPAQMALAVYSVPALNAVNFALTAYTPPTIPYVGWELDGDASLTAALAWVEADDAYALVVALTATVALAWTESDDSWAITGDIASDVVEAAVSWTEEDDTWALAGSIIEEVSRNTVGGPPRVYVDEEWGAYLPKPDPYVVVEVVPTASGVSMVEKAAPEPRFMAKRATKFQHEPEFTDEDLAEARELIERARVASRNRRARALLLLS